MRLLVTCVTALLLHAVCFAASPELRQWDPAESWPGRTQEDARLDRPVQFWGAGIPLREVFARVKEQTGVTLTFSPEGDQNERVPVHLFLNPQQPPTLRELMAQLSWVVDCGFTVTDAPEGKVYALLSTSAAGGAGEELEARVQQARRQREQSWQFIDDKVAECREALKLSRDEVIARYRGTDNRMLINLLDPPRRAATEFLCRHAQVVRPMEVPGEHVEESGFGTTVPSAAFAEQDITELRAAFGLAESVLRDPQFSVDVYVEAIGQLKLNVGPEYTGRAPRPAQGHYGPYLIVDATDSPAWTGADELALRRALGEEIPADREAEALRSLEAEVAAAKQARFDAERSLSPRALALLQGTPVVVRDLVEEAPLAPWVAQEAVARATGRHVVSDGLLWSGRYCGLPDPWMEDKEAALSALDALDSFTHLRMDPGLRRPSWEWGDAGNFLRFRTADRDTWRAAMVPPEFVRWADSLVAPHLPNPQALAKRPHALLRIPVGLVYWTRMLGQLSDPQLQLGMEVCYGDPGTPLGVARQHAVAGLLWAARTRPKLTRFLASLRDDQWAQLKGEGLQVRTGLLPDQQQLLARASGRSTEKLADQMLTIVDQGPVGSYWLGLAPAGSRPQVDRDSSAEDGREQIIFNNVLQYVPTVISVDVWAAH